MGPRYSEEQAREAISSSNSLTEALRKLGMRAAGGNHATLRKYLAIWQISTDHFREDRRAAGGVPAKPLDQVLVEHSNYDRGKLKERLYSEGLKARRCELCGQGEIWQDRRMSLILDHVNGVWNDNRLENLRIVCPNCNATLETHCGRLNRIPREQKECLRCGKSFISARAQQNYCSRACGQRWLRRPGAPRPGARRIERPPHEQLLREIAESSFVAVGRRYGVTDNAIRKWLRAYEREREEAENAKVADLEAA